METNPGDLLIQLKRNLVSKLKIAHVDYKDDGTAVYQCVECADKFENKEELEVHSYGHNKEYRFLCGICGAGLKRKEHLERHTSEHMEVRPHACMECGKAFKRKEHLTIHMSIHVGNKDQVCVLCNKSFYRKDHLQKHLQTHNKMFVAQNLMSDELDIRIKQEYDDLPVKSEVISADEDNSMEYQEAPLNEPIVELNEVVPKVPNERPFSCPICFKSYKRRDHLKIHSWTHLKKDKVCPECGKAFHRDEQLLVHMNVHMQRRNAAQREEPHIASYLEQHMDEAIITDDGLLEPRLRANQERKHECTVCHKRFKRRQHLKVHSNVHSRTPLTNPGAPSIWCSTCNEGFTQNEQFESHNCSQELNITIKGELTRNNAHAGKNENEYPEEYEQPEHPIPDPAQEKHIPVPVKVYVCKYCNKPFKRKDHYKIHLHIHTGVKSLFCECCGKGFYRKDHLQKHETIHMKDKKVKREMPGLVPLSILARKPDVKPEITIHAPTKLRVPFQIKVPYEVVMSMENGEERAVTIDPNAHEVPT